MRAAYFFVANAGHVAKHEDCWRLQPGVSIPRAVDRREFLLLFSVYERLLD